MTKKDYIKFARTLRGIKPQKSSDIKEYGAKLSQWGKMIEAIADIFEDDNGRFDRNKFYKEVGYV